MLVICLFYCSLLITSAVVINTIALRIRPDPFRPIMILRLALPWIKDYYISNDKYMHLNLEENQLSCNKLNTNTRFHKYIHQSLAQCTEFIYAL